MSTGVYVGVMRSLLAIEEVSETTLHYIEVFIYVSAITVSQPLTRTLTNSLHFLKTTLLLSALSPTLSQTNDHPVGLSATVYSETAPQVLT